MEDTNEEELLKAIEIFKHKYGIKTPLDMFKLDDIIRGLRQEQTKVKRKGRKK